MSDRNVHIVRRGFDAFQAMDMDQFVADWHPEMVWNVEGYEHWPGTQTEYRGPPEILAEFANFMGTVKRLDVDVHEVKALGPDRVLAIYTETRLNEGDAEPVELDIGDHLHACGRADRAHRGLHRTRQGTPRR